MNTHQDTFADQPAALLGADGAPGAQEAFYLVGAVGVRSAEIVSIVLVR